MSNLHGRIPTQALDQEEHDKVAKRRRVATYIDGDSVAYEDENFDAADDNTVMDVEADLERKAHGGFFTNDGPGEIKLEISADGVNYGGQHTLRGGDILDFQDLSVSKIRLGYVDPTSYRCMAG